MPGELSGRLSESEKAEATRLARWTALEWLVLLVILGLAAGAGVVVPAISDQPIQVLPLTLGAVMLAFLWARQRRRRALLEAALGEPIDGAWDHDGIQGVGGGACRVGSEALLIWRGNERPVVLGASVFADPGEWAQLRTLIGERCRVANTRRNLVLAGSVIAWLGLLIYLWSSWDLWIG